MPRQAVMDLALPPLCAHSGRWQSKQPASINSHAQAGLLPPKNWGFVCIPSSPFQLLSVPWLILFPPFLSPSLGVSAAD